METKEHRAAGLFLPGIIMPAVLRYAPLLRELGSSFECRTKEIEVYSLSPPPSDYSVGWEVDGLYEAALRAGLERFHLYGHSAGGAVSLAFTAQHPEMVLSLTVDEPAFDFTDQGRSELEPTLELVDMLAANPGEAMPRFLR